MYTDNYTASIKQLLKVVPELNGSGHDRLPGEHVKQDLFHLLNRILESLTTPAGVLREYACQQSS